jgi:L-threonylcarbamoyladenylate synthase
MARAGRQPRLKPLGTTVSPRALAAHLRAGGLIAYATRGCFGLGCLPGHVTALRRLVRLKRRPIAKGLIVVADRRERLRRLMAPLAPELAERAAQRWPGHWTWLVPVAAGVPGLLRGRSRRLAVRVDNYPPVRGLCARLATALVSTSANRSGQRPARTTREARRAFAGQVWIVPGRCERHARPSTIADLSSGRVLRR